VRKREER
jgi:hypothetical protein